MALLPEALHRVRPLNTPQRRALPEDAAALSCLLTSGRGDLRRPYWSSPAFVSAYLYYFLPWNLLRLVRLFASLDLPDPRGTSGEALLTDLGSGPLTLPIALWLARPDLDDAPLRLLALDSAPLPLALGKALFKTLGGMTGRCVWPMRTERGGLERAGGPRRPAAGSARPWLLTAANVLNECRRPARLHSFDRQFPTILVVEPGTRLGGKTIMTLREEATADGFRAIAPCPHNTVCPLAEGKGRPWCHFTFDCAGAPDWLERLSQQAGLTKTSLSLSFLLLRRMEVGRELENVARSGRNAKKSIAGTVTDTTVDARVLSAPFAVPGLGGRARYACCAKGLLLLENAERLSQGDLIRASLGPDMPRDAKSGAWIVRF